MLLYTFAHTEFSKGGIHNTRENYGDDTMMDDINDFDSLYCMDKESVDEVLADEEDEGMEEYCKEWMKPMVADNKPHFANF